MKREHSKLQNLQHENRRDVWI